VYMYGYVYIFTYARMYAYLIQQFISVYLPLYVRLRHLTVGHGRTGEVQNYNEELLQECAGDLVGL
jgi:hypothetical protein